ncbi:MAG: serine/threonine protein phosphatase [Pseudomonadota bacterium]|nr:serine/threonine protein phosphatase [Pseudomonadota bacterium]MDE3038422.1 serine/threonine protein phosphatase [Pseudomonadota bacterium]
MKNVKTTQAEAAQHHAGGFVSRGKCIYAIGDIHGMLAPLQQLHHRIKADEKRSGAKETLIVFLGDYIDRGKRSKEVVDYLIEQQRSGQRYIFLKGNHEQGMLQFLADPVRGSLWLKWGGIETIASYGIDPFTAVNGSGALPRLAANLQNALPPEHQQFYRNLKPLHEEDGYIFVHAGLRPGVPLAEQKEQDLLSIREEFVDANHAFGKQIVFGHTIFEAPYHKNGKIGVDTGAYMTGTLTCAVLEENRVRFLNSL